MDAWYYARDGEQQGPYPKDELISMLAAGSVRPTDHVWTEGMVEWQLAGAVSELTTSHVGTTESAGTLTPRTALPRKPSYG